MESTPGQLLREARKRHGVSQKQLAIRAGTTQSAISRIEGDKVSPSVETLRSLLQVLGEDLVLGVVEPDSGVDRSMIQGRFRLTPSERLEYGRGFANLVIRNSPNPRRKEFAS